MKYEIALKRAFAEGEIAQFFDQWKPVKIALHKSCILIINYTGARGYITLHPDKPVTKRTVVEHLKTNKNNNYPIFRNLHYLPGTL